MRRVLAAVFLIAALSGGAAVRFVGPTGPILNPILPGFYSDPSTCRGPDGKFCMAVSTLHCFPVIPLFESENLIDWRLAGHLIEKPGVVPLGGEYEFFGAFAPTLRYHAGRFYLVADIHAHAPGEGGAIYGPTLFTAERLSGPWSAPRRLHIRAADPSIDFIGEKCYFSCTDGHDIMLAEFDITAAALAEPLRPVWTGTGGIWPEGPHVFKRGDWYYLMIAEGGTQYGHCETIARSRSVYGPYEGCPDNPIAGHARRIAQGSKLQALGHGDFVYDDAGNGYFICHAIRPQYGRHSLLGRETVMAPLTWTDEGWPVVNGGRPLDDKAWNETRLPKPDWIWVGNPTLANFTLDEKTAVLRPTPVRLNSVTNVSPTFVGQRQTALRQTYEATLLAPPDDGVEAGIACFMGRSHHYAIVTRRRGERTVTFVRHQLGCMTFDGEPVAVPDLPIRLRIASEPRVIRLYANDTLLATCDPRHISSETNTDCPYNGVLYGLFAVGPEGSSAVTFAL